MSNLPFIFVHSIYQRRNHFDVIIAKRGWRRRPFWWLAIEIISFLDQNGVTKELTCGLVLKHEFAFPLFLLLPTSLTENRRALNGRRYINWFKLYILGWMLVSWCSLIHRFFIILKQLLLVLRSNSLSHGLFELDREIIGIEDLFTRS